jgi:integrase
MSEKLKFTDLFLHSIKPAPPGKRIAYWDTQTGFGIRVSDKSCPDNIGSFVLVRRMPGNPNPTARKIGSYPAMKLADARAKEWRESRVDPKVKAAEEAREQKRLEANTFSTVFETYARERLDRLRTGKEVRRSIALYALPVLGEEPITRISRKQVKELIVDVHNFAPVAANRLLSHLKTFFNWSVEEEFFEHPPTAVMRPLTKEIRRDRVLNDEEIRAIWKAAEEIGTVGSAIQFLLVTGQRRSEVGGMTWAEVDRAKRLWTLPKERTKAARAHEVPLSNLALSILDSCPELNAFVFASSRLAAAPIANFCKGNASLDRVAPIAPWRLHDLRRTCATNLVDVGVDRIIIAKILNHAEREVTAIYDRHPRAEEKRVAMDRWAARLMAIVDGTGDNIVPIRKI